MYFLCYWLAKVFERLPSYIRERRPNLYNRLLCFQMFRSRRVSVADLDPELAEKLRKTHRLEETLPIKRLHGNAPKDHFNLDTSGKKKDKRRPSDERTPRSSKTVFLAEPVNDEETHIGLHESVEFLHNDGLSGYGSEGQNRRSNYL
mmetsp:Transcript_60138/g.68464  ORF Transcript_60138/g.68464 Transcript_60138/m.68464 type:complete len:147 (-) Transcript_60138:153-593(-)